MELTKITATKDDARKAFLEYRAAVRERHNTEDEQIMRGYKWLAGGDKRQLLTLTDTIIAGGVVSRTGRNWDRKLYTTTLPALGIVRADARVCFVDANADRVSFIADERWPRSSKRTITIRWDGFQSSAGAWQAMVPIIPPALRPNIHLRNYHILFEADWAEARPVAPHDPALLKHIGGDLYAVVAMWDLTDIERAVLSGRA